MSGRYFIPLWPERYTTETTHFSCVQHGAYIQLIVASWANGGSIPNDERRICRTIKLQPDRWRKIQKDVLAKFVVEGDDLVHPQLRADLEKAHDLARKRASAGSTGGKSKSLKKQGSVLANGRYLQQQNPTLQTTGKSNKEKKEEDGVPHENEDDTLLWRQVKEAAARAAAPAQVDEAAPVEAVEVRTDQARSRLAPGEAYAFSDGHVRVTEAHFARMKQTYPSINLMAELTNLAAWDKVKAAGKDWWGIVQGALLSKERQAAKEIREAKIKAEADAKAGVRKADRPRAAI